MGEPLELLFNSVTQAQWWWKINGNFFDFDKSTPVLYQTEIMDNDKI